MNTYRVTLLAEQDGPGEQDMEIIRVVQAASDLKAVEKAKLLVRRESLSVNAAKIWVSFPEIIRNTLVARKFFEEMS